MENTDTKLMAYCDDRKIRISEMTCIQICEFAEIYHHSLSEDMIKLLKDISVERNAHLEGTTWDRIDKFIKNIK